MDKFNVNPYTMTDNQIAFSNAAFAVEAKGQAANTIADAVAFAICCFGIAAIIKSVR